MGEIKDLIEDLDSMSDVFLKHIEKFGLERQITVLGEEATELAQAVFKWIRYKQKPMEERHKGEKKEVMTQLYEEYIDVLIMLKQFEYFINFGGDVFLPLWEEKLNRAKERVK